MKYTQYSAKTVDVRIPYSYECEKCGQHNTGTMVIPGGVGVANFDAQTAQRRAQEQVRKRLAQFKKAADEYNYSWLPDAPCPACSYLQSWQIKGKPPKSPVDIITTIAVLAIDLLCISVVIVLFETSSGFNLAQWLAATLLLFLNALPVVLFIRKRNLVRRTPRVSNELEPTVEWTGL